MLENDIYVSILLKNVEKGLKLQWWVEAEVCKQYCNPWSSVPSSSPCSWFNTDRILTPCQKVSNILKNHTSLVCSWVITLSLLLLLNLMSFLSRSGSRKPGKAMRIKLWWWQLLAQCKTCRLTPLCERRKTQGTLLYNSEVQWFILTQNRIAKRETLLCPHTHT